MTTNPLFGSGALGTLLTFAPGAQLMPAADGTGTATDFSGAGALSGVFDGLVDHAMTTARPQLAGLQVDETVDFTGFELSEDVSPDATDAMDAGLVGFEPSTTEGLTGAAARESTRATFAAELDDSRNPAPILADDTEAESPPARTGPRQRPTRDTVDLPARSSHTEKSPNTAAGLTQGPDAPSPPRDRPLPSSLEQTSEDGLAKVTNGEGAPEPDSKSPDSNTSEVPLPEVLVTAPGTLLEFPEATTAATTVACITSVRVPERSVSPPSSTQPIAPSNPVPSGSNASNQGWVMPLRAMPSTWAVEQESTSRGGTEVTSTGFSTNPESPPSMVASAREAALPTGAFESTRTGTETGYGRLSDGTPQMAFASSPAPRTDPSDPAVSDINASPQSEPAQTNLSPPPSTSPMTSRLSSLENPGSEKQDSAPRESIEAQGAGRQGMPTGTVSREPSKGSVGGSPAPSPVASVHSGADPARVVSKEPVSREPAIVVETPKGSTTAAPAPVRVKGTYEVEDPARVVSKEPVSREPAVVVETPKGGTTAAPASVRVVGTDAGVDPARVVNRETVSREPGVTIDSAGKGIETGAPKSSAENKARAAGSSGNPGPTSERSVAPVEGMRTAPSTQRVDGRIEVRPEVPRGEVNKSKTPLAEASFATMPVPRASAARDLRVDGFQAGARKTPGDVKAVRPSAGGPMLESPTRRDEVRRTVSETGRELRTRAAGETIQPVVRRGASQKTDAGWWYSSAQAAMTGPLETRGRAAGVVSSMNAGADSEVSPLKVSATVSSRVPSETPRGEKPPEVPASSRMSAPRSETVWDGSARLGAASEIRTGLPISENPVQTGGESGAKGVEARETAATGTPSVPANGSGPAGVATPIPRSVLEAAGLVVPPATAPMGTEAAKALAASAMANVSGELSGGGTPGASSMEGIKRVGKQDKISGTGAQKLPTTADLPPSTTPSATENPDGTLRRAGPIGDGADDLSGEEALVAGAGSARDEKARGAVGLVSEAGVGVEARVNRIEELVTREVVRLRWTGQETMSVVIRPEGGAEVVVHLRQHEGFVEATLGLARGEVARLGDHWQQLHDALAEQNVRLNPAREAGQAPTPAGAAANLNSGMGSGSQPGGQPGSGTESREIFGGGSAEDRPDRRRAPEYAAAEAERPGPRAQATLSARRTAPGSGSGRLARPEGWEFWA